MAASEGDTWQPPIRVQITCGGVPIKLFKIRVKAEGDGHLRMIAFPGHTGWHYTDHPSGLAWITKGQGHERKVSAQFETDAGVETCGQLVRQLWCGATAGTRLEVYATPDLGNVVSTIDNTVSIELEEVLEKVEPPTRIGLRHLRRGLRPKPGKGAIVIDHRRGLALVIIHDADGICGIPLGYGRGAFRVRKTRLWEHLVVPTAKAYARAAQDDGTSWVGLAVQDLDPQRMEQAERAYRSASRTLRSRLARSR